MSDSNASIQNIGKINLFGRLKSWWKKEPVASFRVFLKDSEGREIVIGILKNVCPSELDDAASTLQANWYWERVNRNIEMGHITQPEAFTMRIEPYEL